MLIGDQDEPLYPVEKGISIEPGVSASVAIRKVISLICVILSFSRTHNILTYDKFLSSNPLQTLSSNLTFVCIWLRMCIVRNQIIE